MLYQQIGFVISNPTISADEYGSTQKPTAMINLHKQQFDIDINYMLNKYDIVYTNHNIKLIFSYPLDKPVLLNYKLDNGSITRIELAKLIYNIYEQIYREEYSKTIVPTDRHLEHMYERSTTEGKYGIYVCYNNITHK